MKKVLSTLLVSAFVLAGCSSSSASSVTSTGSATTTDPSEKSEGVMTYAEYAAAASDGTEDITIEAFVQAKQSWWEDNGQGTATIYTQDADGAYFIYNLAIDEDDYNLLVEGQKVQISGTKSEWAGEVEIIDATYEILDGNWVADATDVTELLDDDSLIDYQNQKVSFSGLEVVANDEGTAFLYNWDGSGSEGDDLYFNVSDGENTYTFTVESYLCDSSSDVYQAVEALEVGDVIDCEGFLYWYEGLNPHITSVTVQ